jgi:hypothetical protein
MKEISKAIIKVMAEVKGMEKNSKVGTGASAYDGTKDQDVKEIFNDALQRNGLCIMPIDIKETTQIDRWEQMYNGTPQQKQSVFTKVTVKYLLLHTSGESIELMGYGHGVDPQDKGAGKATTYALKNCLLYTFLTPVGKIDDTDLKHSDDIPTPQPKQINTPTHQTKPIDIPRLETRLRACTTVEELEKTYKSFTDAEQKASAKITTELKLTLINGSK